MKTGHDPQTSSPEYEYFVTRETISRAAKVLMCGGLVAFPTETVYGLGADACNPQAVTRIFAVKGRPTSQPLIVHLAKTVDLSRWAQRVPTAAWRLAEHFWPGPLTLILQRSEGTANIITGGQETIGLRIFGHPTALVMLKAFVGAVAAPSANRFGRLIPTTAADVVAELRATVHFIIDGGRSRFGIESTILYLSCPRPCILRPGVIEATELAEILGELPQWPLPDSPRVSGGWPVHYAPQSPRYLTPSHQLEEVVAILVKLGMKVVVLSPRQPKTNLGTVHWQLMPDNQVAYARRLYAQLREIDGLASHRIVVASPPATKSWEAVRDRLSRAATNKQRGGLKYVLFCIVRGRADLTRAQRDLGLYFRTLHKQTQKKSASESPVGIWTHPQMVNQPPICILAS